MPVKAQRLLVLSKPRNTTKSSYACVRHVKIHLLKVVLFYEFSKSLKFRPTRKLGKHSAMPLNVAMQGLSFWEFLGQNQIFYGFLEIKFLWPPPIF